jgi:pilus assembly protein CpaB
MNNRRRIIIASAAAFLFSGAATLAFSWRLAHAAAAENSHLRSYVAPVHLVAAGQPLQAADLHLIAWPAGSPVQDAFTSVDAAIGRTTLYPVAPGQPLLDHDLTPRGSGPGLAGRIPDGMRALAIKSDEVVGVGGFLSPGLHVDMLVTLHADGGAQTSTVLQDAEVVAVGQQTEPDPTGKAVTATVVTLLLTPDQAERALLSSSQGTVNFVLRNSTDHDSTHSGPVTMADLGAAISHPAPAVLQPASLSVAPHSTPPKHSAAAALSGPAMPEVILSGHTADGKAK